MTSCYPVLMTADVDGAGAFFCQHFGFRTTYEASWYVSLAHRDGGEIALLDPTHPTVPTGFGTAAAGILINIEVDDVDEIYRRLVIDGPLAAVLPLRSETFGQRHFIVAGPAGSLVDVITEIAPGAEHEASYVDQAAGD